MTVLMAVLFKGLVIYPLTDFLAIFFMSIAMFFFRKANEKDEFKYKLVYMFFVGVFSYWAYNIRTIYMFACYTLIGIYIMLEIKNNKSDKIKHIVFGLLSWVVGMFISGVPQMRMNYIWMGKKMIAVHTNSLMLRQLFWGFQYQRYDTYSLGAVENFRPGAGVFFVDNAGMELLEQFGLEEFGSWKEYFEIVFSKPIDVAMIYIRHAINFIFPC